MSKNKTSQELRVRIFGVIDPEEFLQEVVTKRFTTLPYFIGHEMIDDGCEYIVYLYFNPRYKEQVISALADEHLVYSIE